MNKLDRSGGRWGSGVRFTMGDRVSDGGRAAISKTAKGRNEVVEVIGNVPLAGLLVGGLTSGEFRLVLPGEPITETR